MLNTCAPRRRCARRAQIGKSDAARKRATTRAQILPRSCANRERQTDRETCLLDTPVDLIVRARCAALSYFPSILAAVLPAGSAESTAAAIAKRKKKKRRKKELQTRRGYRAHLSVVARGITFMRLLRHRRQAIIVRARAVNHSLPPLGITGTAAGSSVTGNGRKKESARRYSLVYISVAFRG